jgi:hypothetical protein
VGNSITCPQCKKTIANDPLVDAAAIGEGDGTQFIVCGDCGERITFWDISDRLRAQKTIGSRIGKWWQTVIKAGG